MAPHKIFNDPVYGFVTVPRGLLMELVEHPWFQRLRRIRQLGMTDFVYPGALHTRFQHALGAMHLMQQTVAILRSKEVEITDEEAEAAQAAILLHDIGHGPFSHVLEGILLPWHHEVLSRWIMSEMNRQMDHRLTLALEIFEGSHPKRFLHQLVSGQLDMDRVDYLNRDSFFTGVHEGVIGYDRILKMLHVVDNRLVVEEKGVYSIEKFLIARRLMYWQVYLHKTVLVAEKMLVLFFRRLARLYREERLRIASPVLEKLMDYRPAATADPGDILLLFTRLDDHDIMQEVKAQKDADDFLLRFLADGLLNRRLFRIRLDRHPPSAEELETVREDLQHRFAHLTPDFADLLLTGTEESHAYLEGEDEIRILRKNGEVIRFSEETDAPIREGATRKHYLIHPR
ncbi:MAG: HD domain-containing protein [Saprospiraceae bacterium]|nr:HD domain-containing protein [Saprospiraceae bacterium]